jgi:hypothetical protein
VSETKEATMSPRDHWLISRPKYFVAIVFCLATLFAASTVDAQKTAKPVLHG